QLVKPRGGGGDRLRARVSGVVGGGDAGGQALGEGEGLEGGGGGVARAVLEGGAHAQRPQFVEARVEDAEGGVVIASDCDQLVIWAPFARHPDEQSMFGYGRCGDIPGETPERTPHTLASFDVTPPEARVYLTLVRGSNRLHVLDQMGKWRFIKRRLAFG